MSGAIGPGIAYSDEVGGVDELDALKPKIFNIKSSAVNPKPQQKVCPSLSS